MDVQVKLWLQGGSVWEFCCDKDDPTVYGLVSALKGSQFLTKPSPDGLIQVVTRKGERRFFARSSLIAVGIVPITHESQSADTNNTQRPELNNDCSTRPSPVPIIDFAVTTVPRAVDYIHQLIARLRTDLPLRLVVGAPDSQYLERYRGHRFIQIIETSSEEWQQIRDCAIHQRAAWNYLRSLTLATSHPSRQGIVIFEDDVVLAGGWEDRLYNIIHQIEFKQKRPYVLTLYSARPLEEPQPGMHFAPYPSKNFFGSQAIYFPEVVREGFAEYLKAHAVDSYRAPYDLLLGEYAANENIPIFASVPSLVQHIGEVSTGVAGFPHQATHFKFEL